MAIGGVSNLFYLDSGLTLEGNSPVTTISGLEHLEGKQVGVFANGEVVSPNISGEFLVVSNGQITLPEAKQPPIHVGLNYISKLKTLGVNTSSESLQGFNVNVQSIIVHINDSMSFKIGAREGIVQRINITTPKSISHNVNIADTYDKSGEVVILRDQPSPLNIIGLTAVFTASV